MASQGRAAWCLAAAGGGLVFDNTQLVKERDAAVHKAFSQKWGPRSQRNSLACENEKLRRQNQRA